MSKKYLTENKFIMNIIDNLLNEALDALDFGLEFFQSYLISNDKKKLKLSIIQLQRFIEYIFKYFVTEQNPLLVFTDVFEKKLNVNKSKSISLNQAMNFYTNNLAFGLINLHRQYDHEELRHYIDRFNKLRNKVNHWFVDEYDLEDVEVHLSLLFQVIYLVCLDHNLHEKINAYLSDERKILLNKFTTEEWRKMRKAYEIVENYRNNRINHDPKEFNPLDAPVFDCPQCGEHTFILNNKNDEFYCPACKTVEESGTCNVHIVCDGNLVPICYLSEWNFEEGRRDMICDDCYNEFNYRVNKD